MKAIIFESELLAIRGYVAVRPDIETGGDLFGLWTRSGVPVVFRATGPGPNARHFPTAFFQDPAHLAACGAVLYNGAAIQHIGEWHSHHRLGLACPSAGDEVTVWNGLRDLGWERFLLGICCVADVAAPEPRDVSARFYLFDADRGVDACDLTVVPGASPVRAMELALPAGSDDVVDGTRVSSRPAARPVAPQPAPQRWYQERPASQRLIREIKALRSLEEFGFRSEMRPRGDDVELRVRDPEGSHSVWRLSPGFPRAAPDVEAEAGPSDVAWTADMLIAQHIVAGMGWDDGTDDGEPAGDDASADAPVAPRDDEGDVEPAGDDAPAEPVCAEDSDGMSAAGGDPAASAGRSPESGEGGDA